MSLVYARDHGLTVADYVGVLSLTTMHDHRPLANTARIQAMLDGANFIVTARESDGTVIGLARCITDHAWICYCAELAVRDTHQGLGIGKRLLETAKEILGPGIGLNLISEPEAMGFYQRIGMEQYPAFFLPRTDRS